MRPTPDAFPGLRADGPASLNPSENDVWEVNDLSQESDVVAQPENPGSGVANRDIDLNAGEKLVERLICQNVGATAERVKSPGVYRKSRVDGLALVEN